MYRLCRPVKLSFYFMFFGLCVVTVVKLIIINQADTVRKRPIENDFVHPIEVGTSPTLVSTHLRTVGPTNVAMTSIQNYSSSFANLTRLNNKDLLEVILDDHLPESNWTNYKLNFSAKNELNYTFLITGEEICMKDDPYLLIIIPSEFGEVSRRDLLRKTWLRAATTNSWPKREIQNKIKFMFLFGTHSNVASEELKSLTKESILNNDIVMADFEDTYRNLTVKILVGLKWTIKYCSKVTYVLKCDMDTFINVPLMMEFLHYVQNNRSSDNFLIGLRHGYDKPPVVRDVHRWKVTETEYPLAYYPRYMYGHTYLLGRGSLDVLIAAAGSKPLIAPEDAFITGILPKLGGVLRLNAACFTMCCRQIFDCEVVWNKNVAITEIKNNERLERLWSNIAFNQCNNTISITEQT
ncbi:beta-1,3-galactosyltransferase 5-like [Biomphalaria glabrata]|uniref:Hexosyltransferase n=1 Tax=Biomphalaria glabrata TaxID=6526 RepID=A0A9U8EGK9_BIOGL|nr:beta-1,3-galactosyltransferase 5-like [Biomphalaria glabrata]XP_013085692.2 beta-1,3-galactosyltransferase 5-like [Biomphalaria glabrata]XP_013085693.2 beta-1,3-galactosyltransferase 5-like [Biomphalaria glabrata]XP_013085695.2 beta-1,3-galactosyltransferase 5-like [Biomphalaria glabrata]XP_055877330.1 beta-1,3-galactosyltransferase 5-like [Biomphalaria glabrata]